MKKIVLKSPAKLNLFLRVLGKRKDGFHELLTLFERIDLCDEITLANRLDGKIRVVCKHPHVPEDKRNLVFKAAQILKDNCGVSNGIDIHIEKRIPVAAGLAGGSSNAATVLLGLIKLWKINVSQKELLAYAKSIGSDVAFFIHDCSWALGEGRGDKIKKVNIGNKLWQVVVVPKIKMYAKKVYQDYKLELTKQNDDVNILLRALRNNNILEAGKCFLNDLETRILEISPQLKRLKNRLAQCDVKGVGFSGSGPSIFALVGSKKEAEDLKVIIKKRYHQVFIVKTL